MADPVGVTASLIAIAGLAAKITHKIDQMMQQYHDAPAVFEAFRNNSDSARRILNIMSETLRSFPVTGSLEGLDFAGQLSEAMIAIKNTLENVWDRLGSVRRLQKPSRWRMWEKLMVVWDEDQLKKWDEILGRQVTLLNGLLTAQNHYHAQLEKAQQQQLLLPQQQQRSHTPRLPEKPSARSLVQSRSSTSSYEFSSHDYNPFGYDGPNMDDDEPVLDADGSMGYQDRLENELAAVEALPQGQADGRMRSLAAGGGEMAHKVANTLKLRAGALVEGHPDMKFRILLMGKQANGKTTLCNKVLGIDLPQSLYGDSTPFNHVHEEQTFDGANPDLVIHDAGGFENGSTEGADTLRSFLRERYHDAADVSQRIHCIWYVIACNGSKPIHPIDEQFLRNQFGVAKIPVFVVVTKYDRVVDDCRAAAEPGTSERDIEAMAYDEVKRSTLDPLTELVRKARQTHGMNVEICTVGLRKRGAEFTPGHYRPAGLRQCGSARLVELMRSRLAEELRPLLAAVQVVDPKNKLAESVEATTKLYWTAIAVKSIPILPLLTIGSLATVYALTLKKAQRIWKLTPESGLRISPADTTVTNHLIKSIFDIKSSTGMAFLSAVRVADIGGVLAASKMARDLLRLVVGLNVLMHDLWVVQHSVRAGEKQTPPPLSLEQIRKVCADFQGTERRRDMEREIKAVTFANMYKKKEIGRIAERAWKVGVGEVLEVEKKGERAKRKEMAMWDALNPVEG